MNDDAQARSSQESQTEEERQQRARRRANRGAPPSAFAALPSPDLDGELLSYAIEVELKDEVSRIDPVVKKRASNVLKLAEENSRLTAELKALSDRLEAAERKKREAEEAAAAAAAAEAETAAGSHERGASADGEQDPDGPPPPPPAKDDTPSA
ncbi:hypothetical protein AURDEDRAFT_110819 [Auricularia subglabra TFB-10046 SS5]|nr:hypothetical protein AURDEDRAFT_110819 [Auricularia subglabra TFB-10046 SS5]